MSGVEEGGGEPSSGIPPTKKAPTLCQRRSRHGSFNFRPPTSSAAGVYRTRVIIRLGQMKASATFSKNKYFSEIAQALTGKDLTTHPPAVSGRSEERRV